MIRDVSPAPVLPPQPPAPRRSLPRAWTVFRIFIIGLIFYFIFLTLWGNLDQLREREFGLYWPLLLASFPLALLYHVVRGFTWHLMVWHTVGHYPLRTNMVAWMVSLLGKYVPGKVFLYLGRVGFYKGGLEVKARVTISFWIEACCSCLAALTIFMVSMLVGGSTLMQLYTLPAVLVIAVMIGLTHPRLLSAALNVGLRMTGRAPVDVPGRWSNVLLWTALMSVNWLVLGTGFYLLLRSMTALSADHLLYITGSFALAGVIGILALFAPSGIGVREGVLVIMLTPVLGEAMAVVAALVSRVWITLAEVLCAAVAWRFSRRLVQPPDV